LHFFYRTIHVCGNLEATSERICVLMRQQALS